MKEKEKNRKKIYYTIFGILLIIVALVTFYLINNNKSDSLDKQIAYTDLIKQIDSKSVEKIEMSVGSTSIKVKLKDVKEEKTAIIPSTQAFIELIQEQVKNGNDINLIQNPTNIVVRISETLLSLFPSLVIIALFILIFKMQGLGDKGKVYDAEKSGNTNISFKDIAGLEEEKNELIEIVNFLKEPKRFHEMGAKIPKGILLCGKPGTRKDINSKSDSRGSGSTIYIYEWF